MGCYEFLILFSLGNWPGLEIGYLQVLCRQQQLPWGHERDGLLMSRMHYFSQSPVLWPFCSLFRDIPWALMVLWTGDLLWDLYIGLITFILAFNFSSLRKVNPKTKRSIAKSFDNHIDLSLGKFQIHLRQNNWILTRLKYHILMVNNK